MPKITRGEFLGLGAALAGGIVVGATGVPRSFRLGPAARTRGVRFHA